MLFMAACLKACQAHTTEPLTLLNPALTPFLTGYCKAHSADTAIYIELDSSRVFIHSTCEPTASTNPDLLGIEHLGKYTFYVVGSPDRQLYQKPLLSQRPAVGQRPRNAPPPSPPSNCNFELWEVAFRQGQVINYSPKDRINSFVQRHE